MANLPYITRDLHWVGDSREALSGFSKVVKSQIGVALRLVQNGETPLIAKPLKSLGGGVFELRANDQGDTYRAVYAVKLKSAVYVLDCFKKKSKKGKAIPRHIVARIERRLKEARRLDIAQQSGKK